MIDFRYHLVSLVSVLIALAVGIVLGAGPLKEGISESLGNQVVQLRSEKDALRSQLDSTQSSLRISENFVTAELDRIVAGQLSDYPVLLVTLPGADDSLITETEDTLGAAGARLLGPVRIASTWADPSETTASQRAALAASLAPTLGLDTAGTEPALDQVLAALLATHRTTEGETTGPTPSADERMTAWGQLETAGLIGGTFPSQRGALVVVVGAAPVAVTGTASPGGSTLPALAELAATLDAAADGSVVVAQVDPTTAETSESIVSAARDESGVRQNVSTIDNAASPMGQASVVAALLEQIAGRSGQYGLAPGAKSPFPSVS